MIHIFSDTNNLTIKENEAEIDVVKKEKFLIRPVSSFAKNIGLNVIKLQYSSISHKQNASRVSDENLKAKKNPWLSAWIEDQHTTFNDYCRHLLEQRFTKSIKCTFSRSRLCNNHRNMTRLNWIQHARRGHLRIDRKWKSILKRTNNLKAEKVFEILCIACNLTNRPPYLSSSAFVEHMKKYHPHFGNYDDHMAYFRRCVICNDSTTSFQQNLVHRQACLIELVKDVNQVGTEHFNDCFNTQRSMPTYSFRLNENGKANFELKLKELKSRRNSISYWFEMKKNDCIVTPVSVPNGSNHSPLPSNSSWFFLRNNIANSKIYNNSVYDLSQRIAPGLAIEEERIQKFIIPVPFLIKNDPQSKDTFTKWRKNIKPEHLLVQSNAPWYCEICNAMLKNVRTAYCHTKICHPLAGFLEQSCDTCEKRFLTVQGFKNHYNGSKNCPVARRCLVCRQSVSINDLYEHMVQKHQYTLDILMQMETCLICRSKVDNIASHLFDIHGLSNTIAGDPLVDRINYRNSNSFFNCPKCSLAYFSELELRNHMILNDHHLECAQCPTLKFFLSWELMRHLSTTHSAPGNDDRLVCELCSSGNIHADKSMKFASDKVRHFIKCHVTPCSVLLEDIVKVTGR